MIKALLNGILSIVGMLVNFLLTPVNLLISTLFPDLSYYIGMFNTTVNTFFGNTVTWIFNLLPTNFGNLIIVWLTFCISYYGVYYTYLGIVKLFNVIQKIKFW